MSLQLAFGSFGDFATLIQIIRELAILIHDAATMRRDIRRFATFLDEYSATMSCIEDILKSGPSHVLPHTVLQCIRNAVREASRLIRNFITYMYKFQSESWWGEIVIKRLRWALVGKKELAALKEGLISQREVIRTTLEVANLRVFISTLSCPLLPSSSNLNCLLQWDKYQSHPYDVHLIAEPTCGAPHHIHRLLQSENEYTTGLV